MIPAREHGGSVLFEGAPEALLSAGESATAEALRRDAARTAVS